MTATLICGDAIAELAKLAPESVQCCVTSPPYFGLRDYGVAGQMGLEATPDEYIASMVAVMREVRRVLRKDGTLWLNIGDSYAGSGKGPPGNIQSAAGCLGGEAKTYGVKPKDLLGIPWLLAFALRADGWYLRSDIIWHKPNPMPESVRDRPTRSHEYLFLLTKSKRYYYDADAVREPLTTPVHAPGNRTQENWREIRGTQVGKGMSGHLAEPERAWGSPTGRNRRDVWTINTRPFPGAHFATFPEALVEPCIKAGSSERGQCGECGSPWEKLNGRPCGRCRGFIPFQGKSCPACGYVNDWKAGRGLSDEMIANDWSTPGAGAPRKLTPTGKQAAMTAQERLDGGWRPTCQHTSEPVPQTVLDPFSGAATVSVVAERLGRDSIGIDLSPAYTVMAAKRLGIEPPADSVPAAA